MSTLANLMPLHHQGHRWKCPVSGIVVAKELRANLLQRRKVIDAINNDESLLKDFRVWCAASPLLWINLLAWTFVPFEHGPWGKRPSRLKSQPFITWPIQDHLITEIKACITSGQSLAGEKSRDMGMSWCVLGLQTQMLTCVPESNTLALSRKEDLVDARSNPDCLFWKVDYMLERLPAVMLPRVERRAMHFSCPDLGTTLDGETTNSDAGRGGRRDMTFIDEAAAIDDLRAVDAATEQASLCRVFGSTPVPGSYFSTLCRSGKLRVVRMHWSQHPQKGAGRELAKDPESGEQRFVSPWYKAICANIVDARQIATELDMDHMGGGLTVFSDRQIGQHRDLHATAPTLATIRLPQGVRIDPDADPETWPLDQIEINTDLPGKWRFWGTLETDVDGRERPPQGHNYAMGVDVSAGQGASLSVITVADADTGRKIARWSNANTSPEELAYVIFLAGHWFGGASGMAWAAIEANGPGAITLTRLERMGYGNIAKHGDLVAKGGDRLGWMSNRTNKKELLGLYRAALAKGEFINPDREALEQCLQYVYYTTGGVGPESQAEKTDEARAEHGDLVIADALCSLACAKLPYGTDVVLEVPENSPAGRRERRELRKKKRRD